MAIIKEAMDKLLKTQTRGNDSFTGLLVLAFLFFGFIGILNHEMWGDELQAWLIARDSSSVVELFKNLRYEGHPGLWHLSLYLLSRFTQNPVAMQILHLMLATGCIYLFVKFSPFTKLQKVLFTFGYFSIYEYAVISRNYVLGVLLIFSFCSLFQVRTKSYIPLASILFLLANTSVYGLIIAIALALTLLFELTLDKKMFQALFTRKLELTISTLMIIAGVASSVIQITPPSDSSFGVSGLAGGWITRFDTERLVHTILAIWQSYVPIPNFFTYNFWNTNILLQDSNVLEGVGVFFSLGLFGFFLRFFIRKPVVGFLYLSGTLGILLFTYVKFLGWMRHQGHLFILLIACLWISDYYTKTSLSSRRVKVYYSKLFRIRVISTQFFEKYKHKFITAILCTHFAAGTFAFGMDVFEPFCKSESVVQFIQSQHTGNILIAGSRDYVSSTISGYLNREIYFLDINRFGSFIAWNDQVRTVSSQELLEKISKLITQLNKDVLLVLSYELNSRRPDISISSLAKFTSTNAKTIYIDQDYYLYLIQPKDL